MRRLKTLVGASLALGFVLLLGWPVFLGPRPAAKGPELRAYARRAQVYLAGLGGCLVVSGVGTLLMLRRAKAEYREFARENLRRLAEGTREDLLNKRRGEG